MTAPIHLSGVTITSGGRHPAVCRVTGIFAASMTVIDGPNGAGKLTILKALAGELPLVSGTIDRKSVGRPEVGYAASRRPHHHRSPA
jgi:ABC-type Mn2+/Zn2+ transport system ATPase subunit